MKSCHFWTSCCVDLYDSTCERILVNCNSTCSLEFFKFFVLFSRMFFLRSHLFLFVLFAKAYRFCLRARTVNSDSTGCIKKNRVLDSNGNISNNLINKLMCIHLFLSLAIQLSNKELLYFLNLTDNFARKVLQSASDWSTKFLRCKWNLCQKKMVYLIIKMLETICFINRL